MKQVAVKTHLIITDIHSEYDIRWTGRICDAKPKLENGLPIFVIISGDTRMELNTIDMKRIESVAKSIAHPKGRQAVTTDKSRIYIKEENGNEFYLGVVVHRRVKKFQQMYDKVGVR